jgi:hypothetical protein
LSPPSQPYTHEPPGRLVGCESFHARIWFGDGVVLMHVLAGSQLAKVLEGLCQGENRDERTRVMIQLWRKDSLYTRGSGVSWQGASWT